MSERIESLETELRAVCSKNGWELERTGYSDSTNSRYYTVRKPTDIKDEYDCVITIDADVRLSDHENQSATSYHDNKLFNVAGGRFSDTLKSLERSMLKASVIDADYARERGSVDADNVQWK